MRITPWRRSPCRRSRDGDGGGASFRRPQTPYLHHRADGKPPLRLQLRRLRRLPKLLWLLLFWLLLWLCLLLFCLCLLIVFWLLLVCLIMRITFCIFCLFYPLLL